MSTLKSRFAISIVSATLALLVFPTSAYAESCYDLWYARNAIFDDNGFCFKSDLGRETFDNSDCYTSNPRLSNAEKREVARIKAREKAKRCKVNN